MGFPVSGSWLGAWGGETSARGSKESRPFPRALRAGLVDLDSLVEVDMVSSISTIAPRGAIEMVCDSLPLRFLACRNSKFCPELLHVEHLR
jgi:hypothetical protein